MIKTEQIHEFDCEIYPRKLWVAVGVPYAVIKDMFEDVAPMDENTAAQVDNTRRLKPDIKGGLLVRFENRTSNDIRKYHARSCARRNGDIRLCGRIPRPEESRAVRLSMRMGC